MKFFNLYNNLNSCTMYILVRTIERTKVKKIEDKKYVLMCPDKSLLD